MRKTGPRQLSFVFADSPSGDGKAERSDASAPRNFLLQKAKRKKTIGPDAGVASPPAGFGSAHAGLLKYRSKEPDAWPARPVL